MKATKLLAGGVATLALILAGVSSANAESSPRFQLSGECAGALHGASTECVDEFYLTFDSGYSEWRRLDARALRSTSALHNVAGIEQDQPISITDTQVPAPWQLDRLDQGSLPLDNTYTYLSSGKGVRAYVVDTGVRADHAEFQGRVLPGFSTIGGAGNVDCNGHGTHVAGLIAGGSYGAAKEATIVPVRVLDCNGTGSVFSVYQGLVWIAENSFVGEKAVVNMSLSGLKSQALDDVIASLSSQGLNFVVAAGNDGADACAFSPSGVSNVLTVGASDRSDSFASFSNDGACVDVIAPGVSLFSAGITSRDAVVSLSGTSMAAGVVSGVVARILEAGYQRPSDVSAALAGAAARNVLTGVPEGTKNLLIQALIDDLAPGATPGGDISAPGGDISDGDSVVVEPLPGDETGGNDSSNLPLAPGRPKVTNFGWNTVKITWVTAPDFPSPITGQTLTIRRNGGVVTTVELAASQESFTYTSEAFGTGYTAAVSARNALGAGPESSPSQLFAIEANPKLVSNLGPDDGYFSSWMKRLPGNQAKFYAKYLQVGKKVQFMLQQGSSAYRQVGWKRLEAESLTGEGAYSGMQNAIYFIRTVNLQPGKNRLKILVDGVQIGKTITYNY